MSVFFPLLAMLAAQAPQAAPVAGPQEAPEDRYRRCTDQIHANPASAVETANAWLAAGGSLYARQCLGLARVALEQWAPAAEVYELAAAEVPTLQGALRADFLVQAGNAWIAAGQLAKAKTAFDQALTIPQLTDELRGEAHLDRSRVLAQMNDDQAARRDLDRALELVPSDPLAWYLSAALARREGNLARGRADIGRALEMVPGNPDMQLLAGTLAGLAGDIDEAERLYRRVVELAPSSGAGRAAAASLATLREVPQAAEARPAAAPPAGEPAPPPASTPDAASPQSR